MQRLGLLVFLCGAYAVAAGLPVAMLGTWTPINHSTPHAILGPTPVLKNFAMTFDNSTGDFWMSAIHGQVFRIRDDLMDYCFAGLATSPFYVNSTDESRVVFCYSKGKRMRTHKVGATGCDAAHIILELKTSGTLELTFLMSPPIKHAWVELTRTGGQPTVASYIAANRGDVCDPLHPGPPTDVSNLPDGVTPQLESLCPIVKTMKERRSSGSSTAAADLGDGQMTCRQLDGLLWHLNPKEKIDIRLQHSNPSSSCWPCNVSYSVSALVQEDQYVAVGFKGMAYRAPELLMHERPNYFGMATDAVDDERTSGVIVLGYASSSGSCVREMKAEHYVGTPTDVEGNPHLFGTSVERVNGRTVVRFTIEQHAGHNASEMDTFFNAEFLSMRVMWAIGGVSGDRDCKAAIQMHSARGLSPQAWFNQNPKCSVDPVELGSYATATGIGQLPQAALGAEGNALLVV